MKKVLLTFALALSMSAPAFAATVIGDWAALKSTTDYAGTQKSTVAAGKSANGIVFTRHNLSSYGEHYQAATSVSGTSTKYAGINPLSVATTEICVFCHTPHFGKTTEAPLWNRGSSATGYIAYGSTGTTGPGKTLAGTDTNVGGASLACLSCHDGVTTLDNLINKPGKGSGTAGAGSDAGWVFGEVGNYIGDTNNYANESESTILASGKATSRLNIGAGNSTSTTRSTSAVDLSNDHPIAVVYNDDRASLRPTDTLISGITMNNARMNYGDSTIHALGESASGYYGESTNLWAVKGYISNTATIQDLLRDSGGQVACSSCHDPHYKNQTNTDPAVVCSYFPKKSDRNGTHEIYGNYADGDETDMPTTEGCWQASTGFTVAATVTGLDFGTLDTTPNSMSAFNEHYLSEVDSDGLFLRRVGGNSNSGVCRTCHNK